MSLNGSIQPAQLQLPFVRGYRVSQQHGHGYRANAAGHRRDPARNLFHFIRGDVADDSCLPVFASYQINADINDSRTGFYHVTTQETGLANGNQDSISASRVNGNRTSHVVANSYRRSLSH